MRAVLFLMPGWNEPETAPLGEEIILAVTDGQGEPYLLQSPCKRTADSWISSKNARLLVTPVKWRRYAKRRDLVREAVRAARSAGRSLNLAPLRTITLSNNCPAPRSKRLMFDRPFSHPARRLRAGGKDQSTRP
jgi:hypothetical protein